MGKEASRRVTIPRSSYNPYGRTNVTKYPVRNPSCDSVGGSYELEDGEILEESCTDSGASSDGFWNSDNYSSSSSNTSYSSSDAYAPWTSYSDDYHRTRSPAYFQRRLRPRSTESQIDYYTRTAPYKYKRRIARHSGIVHSPHILEHTCAATCPGQKTCVHPSSIPGDIVNYIPTGNFNDVLGDCANGGKLTMHFMVLLPAYYKPVDLQANRDYHAALVISKNPIGPNTLLCPQTGDDKYKAENVPIFQCLVYDAHSRRRSLIIDDESEKQWQWKANTSVGYHVKTVHQDTLHAVIYPDQPTYGLRLSDGSFRQLLADLGE
ncbi:MAG: hypothetical protein Q9166_001647 [cf. Caloplaca sp. 2 TL-2023]